MTHHPAPRRPALFARFMPAASSTAFVFAIFHQLAMPIMAALALALIFVAPVPVRAQPAAEVVINLPASGTYNDYLVGASGTHFIYNWAGTGTVTIQGTRTSHGGAVYFSLAGGYFTATSSNGGTILFQSTTVGPGVYAAGIYMNSSAALPARLDVTGAHFRDNVGTGDTYGGGIWMQNAGGTILANYTLFDRNIANRGAGIGFATGNTLFAENAVFSNNRAANTTSGGYGGAIYSSGTSIIHLDNSKFSSNVASTSGGAIYGGGIVSARNTIFEGNYTIAQATGNAGGAFYFTSAGSGSLDITSGTFSKNTAGVGGALYVNAPAYSVQFINATNATFTSNTAGLGGAIYVYVNAAANATQHLDISGATFKDNTARDNTGGAIYVAGVATGSVSITATGAVFTGNIATNDAGGAIRLAYSDIDLTGAVFTSNTANRNGGGAVWLNTGNMDLTNAQFIDNTIEGTGWGGAVSITTSSTTTGTLRLGATAGETSVFRGNTLGILRDDTMVAIPSAIDFGASVITGTIISGDPDIPDVITYDYNYTQVLEVAVATGGILDMQDPIRSRASGTTIATFDGGGLWKLGGTNSIGGYHFTDFTAISGTLALYAGAELGLWSTDHPDSSTDDTFTLYDGVTLQTLGLTTGGAAFAATAIISSDTITIGAATTLAFTLENIAPDNTDALLRLDALTVITPLGTQTVNILGDTLPLSTGTYKLIEAASATFYPNANNYTLLVNGAAPVTNIHSTYALSSDNTAKTLSLIATLTNGSLTWSGAATPGVWDNFTTANWTGFDTLFVRGDTILFDDTSFSGATSQTITVATEGVTVGGMAVNNSAGRDYTFAGGAIKNTGLLEKTGGGLLTIGGTLAFTGTDAAGQTAAPGTTVRAGVDFGALSAAGTIFDSADGAVTVDLSNETGGMSAAALAGGGLQGTLLTGALTARGADADVSGPGGDAAGLALDTLTGDASIIATGAIEAGGGSGDTGGKAAALRANTVTTTGTLRFDTLSITGGDGAGGDAAGIYAQEITAAVITLGGSAADSGSGSVSITAGNAGATGDAFGLAVGNASGDTLTVQNATIVGATASAVSAGTLAFDATRLAGVTVDALDVARGIATELFSGTLTIDGALAVSASAAATGASVGLEIGDTQSGVEIRLKNTGAILATGDALAAGILTGPSAAGRVVLEGGAIRATTADGSAGADYAAGAGQAEIVMTGLGDTLVFSPGAGAVFNNGGNALRVFGAETIEFANGATQWGADWGLLSQAGADAPVATVRSGAALRTSAITNFNKAAGSTLAIEGGGTLFTAVSGGTPHVLSTGTFSLASNAILTFDLAGATAGNATALLELDADAFITPFGAQKINLLGTVADGDTYLLLHAANATFGAAAYDILYNNSPLSGRIAITATNSNTDKTLSVKLTIQNDVLTWLGGAAGAERVWDVNTSANWIGLEPTFLNSDAVLFTSSAAGEIVVGAGGVTVKNLGAAPAMLVNGGVYVFTGADATAGIIGNGDFRIAGAATDVTFNTAAAFTGAILLDAGRLTLGAGAGAGALAVSSGTLAVGAGGSLAVAGTASLGAGAVFDIVAGIGSGTALTASAFVTAPGAVINITGYDISGVEEFPTTPALPVYTLVSASETLARNYTFTVAGVAALEVPQDESTFIALREILDDAKKVQATTALVWTNITPASAHGTFNIASGSFTLGSNLTDNTAATAGAGMNGWDGKTLSKTGAGTLVLAGLNTHTGPTRVLEGTLVNTGTITGVAEVLADAALGNTGKLDTILQTGGAVGNTGEIAAFTQIEGVADNAGAVGTLTLTGTAALFNNIAGGIVTGAANIDNGILGNAAGGELAGPVFITAAGLAENSGLVSGTVEITGRLSNGVTGEITTLVQNAGSVENTGTVVGAVINGGVFTNYSTGIVTGPVLLNVGTFTNGDTAIIAAPVTIASGARLVFNRGSIRDTITNAGIVEFNNTTALTLSTEIVGTGTFRKTAAGNLTITVPQSSFEGQVWIGSGTVILAAENALSAAGEVLLSAVATSPGVLNMSGLNQHIRQLSGGFYQNRRTMVYFGGTDSTYATLTLDNLTDTATFVMRGDIDTGDRDRLILNSPGSGEHEIRLTLTGTTEAPALLRVVENTSGTAGGAVFTGTVDYQAARYEFVQGAGDGSDNGSWFLADTGRLSTIGTILLQTGVVAGAEWHYAMDSQRQRLGELRTSALTDAVASKHGNVWMRASGYRLDAGGQLYGLKFSESLYEISAGADRLYKRKNAVAYLGLFMQGVRVNRDFDLHGTGESNTGGGGIYAGWVHNDGWYADVAGKYDVSKNKIEALADAGAPASADYRTRSSGLSLEVGRLMPMGRKSWMEMSLQAAVGWLGSTDYTTDTGIRVHGDQAEAHQYRARLRVGTSRTGPWFPSAHIAFVSAETKDGKIRINRGELYAPVVDRTRIEAGAGIARALPWAGAQVYLDYEYAHASVYTRPWSFSLGYRQAW